MLLFALTIDRITMPGRFQKRCANAANAHVYRRRRFDAIDFGVVYSAVTGPHYIA